MPTNNPANPVDVLGMSDEDFMKDPPLYSSQDSDTDPAPEVDSTEVDNSETTVDVVNDPPEEQSTENEPDGAQVTEGEPTTETEETKTNVPPEKVEPEDNTLVPEKKSEDKTEKSDVDYKSAYDTIMAPFKANGKMIEIRNPEEAVQLMKMGANYTKKMQSIQQHRKVLMMLDNNQLLDEDKLSYLIDLSNKNPDAIKKLVKDAGIDPLDIDTNVEPTYVQGNHRVSDEEDNFKAVLEELGSNQEGKETLRVINTEWDQASKESLWSDPELMTTIHQQRDNGIYARITSEIERQKTLGKIPPNVSFIQAYKVVGDFLHEQGAFSDLTGKSEKQPIARKVSTPKPKVVNDTKASAASASRSSPKKATAFVNPFAQNDDEFMKQFENRV